MRLWPAGGLWWHPDFAKLWSAETVSQFGTQFTQLALPLVAIDVLHVSAFKVAALTTVEFLPFLLVSLPAGVMVDRFRRRPLRAAADARGAARGTAVRPHAPVPQEHRRLHRAVQLLREHGLRRTARVRPPAAAPEPARHRARAHAEQHWAAARRL